MKWKGKINFDGRPQYATDGLITSAEVDTISGSLQINIDGKSDIAHFHDDRYYTESEVDDLITTVSGKLDDHNEMNNLDYVSSGHIGFASSDTLSMVSAVELTIVSGTVTCTQTLHRIDTEGDIATDDLDTILGGIDGDIIIVRAENGTRTVVLKDGTGNLKLGGRDLELIDTNMAVMLFYSGVLDQWLLIGDGGGSATAAVSDDAFSSAWDGGTAVAPSRNAVYDIMVTKSDLSHLHDDRYYTESEVDTISGALNTKIDGKSDTDHIHDSRYYTETELNEGQLDNRYYTESETDTISGSLQTNIDGKSDIAHFHDDRYYIESEVDTISGSLSSEIDSDISTHTSNSDAHHSESHNVASHSDTTASGAQLNTLVGGGNTTLHIHDSRYYTESEVDTISGSLQINIDGKSNTNHLHDDRYYTETELNNGQLDNRYYTESEINTISGSLNTKINDKADVIHIHDDRYYTETEIDTISGSLQTNIDGKSDLTHLHDDRYYTETELNNGQLDTRYYTELEVDDLITTVSGKLDDHNEMNNLDYASAGHTGFQPSGDYATDSELTTLSGALKNDIDGKDNYSSWSFAVDGSTKDAIISGDVLDFVGGDNISITRSAEDQITISGSVGGGEGGLSWEVISTDTNAVNGSGYLINASSGNVTLTLPSTPSEGATIGACDIYEQATASGITIARNGSNIEGAAEDLTIDVDGSGFTLVYADATRGWEIVSEIGGSENSISDTAYAAGWNGVTDIAPSKNVIYDEMETKPDKTTAAWSKSIGSGGDYATWAAMIADMPDLIAHQVTVMIKAGTTLTETCDLKNKHGLTNEARITIQSEKYFPTSGVIPTADSATATTLRDAALASAVLGNDYFNGCWVFIVHGTGTDNSFVPITDYVDTTGDVVVASWPGTQPDNTSRYLIVGALIDGGSARNDGINIVSCTVSTDLRGVGCKDVLRYGLSIAYSGIINCNYDGVYNIYYSGVYCSRTILPYLSYCGIVKCNTSDTSTHGGIKAVSANQLHVRFCGISDNNKRGIYVTEGSFASTPYNFGDGNGTWGIYCEKSGQAAIVAPECSGSSGNHSDPGTAGTASADQASAY